MTLGRGGPSLYVSSHLSQLYGDSGMPTSPHALRFDSSGAVVNGAAAPSRQDMDQPTPLQKNLAQLARGGIPGMSTALLSGAAVTNGASPVEGPDHLGRLRASTRSSAGNEPVLANKPSMASFATSSPSPYQGSTLSRNASVANTISGRLSRFGSMLGRKER